MTTQAKDQTYDARFNHQAGDEVPWLIAQAVPGSQEFEQFCAKLQRGSCVRRRTPAKDDLNGKPPHRDINYASSFDSSSRNSTLAAFHVCKKGVKNLVKLSHSASRSSDVTNLVEGN